MQCPKCDSHRLFPTRLELDLAAYQCKRCQGHLVALIAYRDWMERHQLPEVEESVALQLADTTTALQCTRCNRLMTKYGYDLAGHKLDYCSHCDDVWLDAGEWAYLRAIKLAGELPAVLTAPWQRKLKQQRYEKNSAEQWKKKIGSNSYDRVAAFGQWLWSQQSAKSIIDYLSIPRDSDTNSDSDSNSTP